MTTSKAKARAKKIDAAFGDSADAVEKVERVDPLDRLRGKWGFPAFARDFPADDELAALVEAFTDGDYAAVRAGAPALAAKTEDEAVKRAAELLRARTEPDGAARWFFGLTAALLVFLFMWWVVHSGPSQHAPAPAKPTPTVEYVK